MAINLSSQPSTPVDLVEELEKLRARIKYTSSVRFNASRRVRSDYYVAQLTVVILSLWSIFISYILAMRLAEHWYLDTESLTAVGVILPVFIVVFSLIERGDSFLRAHQLEYNARQLRELSDQLFTASKVSKTDADEDRGIYADFIKRYNDIIERASVDHDDIDHFRQLYERKPQDDSTIISYPFSRFRIIKVLAKTYFKRGLYILFWFLPVIFLIVPTPSAKVKTVAIRGLH